MPNIVNGLGQIKVGVKPTPPPTPLLLDIYSGATAAYSLRKLNMNYSGSAIRVRRSSDNTSQDIGFDVNGNLDTTALLSFVGAGNGFVPIWYDQTGNGYNMGQPTFANQPQIVSGGSLITSSGKVAIQYDGTSSYMVNSNSVFSGDDKPLSSIQVVDYLTARYNESLTISRQFGPTANELYNPFRMVSSTQYGTVKRDSGGGVKLTSFGTVTTGIQLLTTYSSGTTANARKNGTLILNNFDVNVNSIIIDNIAIGALVRNAISGYSHMKSMEVILYPTNQSANIVGIESNINTKYSIY
jgi:hypothetical protein